MYLLCILPFLARQFIQVYFKRIVREKAKAAKVGRISPCISLQNYIRIDRTTLSLTSAGNTLQIAFFFVIIPFLESSITRIVSVKLVKHFSNWRRRREGDTRTHTHLLFLRVRKGKVRRRWPTSRNDTSGEIYIVSSKGIEEPGRGLKRGLVGRWTRVQKFRFPRSAAAIHPVARRSRWLCIIFSSPRVTSPAASEFLGY